MKIIYGGDRDISEWVLSHLQANGISPVALILGGRNSSHSEVLRKMCSYLDDDRVLVGSSFRSHAGISLLNSLEPDYIMLVHLQYIVPKEVLDIPKRGVLNLHPAYLPFNRGWHTPSWSILEGTPYGATLHFMSEAIDEGDVVHQRTCEVLPHDTADSLYQRVKLLELQVFKEALPSLLAGTYARIPQGKGTSHLKKDLLSPAIQEIDLEEAYKGKELLAKLRALTTSRPDEAAYFKCDGVKYRIRVEISREE